jgi:hypothetical protein
MKEDAMNDNDAQSLQARLARLADGSIPASEQARLRAQIQASPEQAAALAEQERAVALIRSAQVTAPDSLRQRVDAMIDPVPERRVRRRRAWMLAPTVGLAAAVIVVVLLISGGSSGPTVPQTARLGLAAATLPTPPPSTSDRDLLALRVDDIPFPNYVRSVGWEATGARRDQLHGRHVTTVFYVGQNGRRAGYSIVSGAPLPVPNGTSQWRDGVRYTLARDGSAQIITWRRDGHSCVIAGRSVSNQTLLSLAAADQKAV